MSKKKKRATHIAPPGQPPGALAIIRQPNETPPEALAHASIRPSIQAAMTLMNYNKDLGEISINTLVKDLEMQCALASKGDLTRAEAILMAQAQTLDTLFNNLARRAALNLGEYMNAAETYLRLALKAQSQCRATLESFALIKNPQSVAFVRQANIAHGPQQVNNGLAQQEDLSLARKTENQQNKLMEANGGERLDSGAKGTPGSADSQMETLEPVHRSKDSSGESNSLTQCGEGRNTTLAPQVSSPIAQTTASTRIR